MFKYILMRLIFALIIIFGSLSTPVEAAQNGIVPYQFKPGSYSLGVESTYVMTSANYTERSTSLDFDPEYGYSAVLSEIYGRFDYTKNLSFFAGLPLNYASSENLTETLSSFKVPGLRVGLNYSLDTIVKIIPEFTGYYSAEKAESSEEVLTTDGASYFEIGSHILKKFSAFTFHGFLSYQYRMEGYSSLLNYQTDLTYLGSSFAATFGLRGFESVTDDDYTNNPNYRFNYLKIVNGSSYLFGSVNPSRMDLFGQIKFSATNSIDVYGGVAKSLRGKNSGDILTVTVGLEYFFEPLFQRRRSYIPKEPDTFQYEEEKIDPIIEKKIRTYSKPKAKPKEKKRIFAPKKKKPSTKKRIRKRKALPRQESTRRLEPSEKEFGSSRTNTSPIESNPKSKKKKRVHIEF